MLTSQLSSDSGLTRSRECSWLGGNNAWLESATYWSQILLRSDVQELRLSKAGRQPRSYLGLCAGRAIADARSHGQET